MDSLKNAPLQLHSSVFSHLMKWTFLQCSVVRTKKIYMLICVYVYIFTMYMYIKGYRSRELGAGHLLLQAASLCFHSPREHMQFLPLLLLRDHICIQEVTFTTQEIMHDFSLFFKREPPQIRSHALKPVTQSYEQNDFPQYFPFMSK